MRRGQSSRFPLLILFLVVIAAGYFLLRDRQSTNTEEGSTVTGSPYSNETEEQREDSSRNLFRRILKDTGTIFTADIEVFFSNTYSNTPAIAEADPYNIDRQLTLLLATAVDEIDCAVFELESSRIAEALIAAKERGVRVRIVAESDYIGNREMQQLIIAGIPVVGDERSAFMHNKFFVIDRSTVWTGSYNATDNGAWKNNNNGVVIRSREIAENYLTEFEEMFVDKAFGPRSPSNTPHTLVKLPEGDIYNYFAPEDDVAAKILRFVKLAKERIRFLAFSITDDDLGDLLVEKKREGIDIAGIIETRGSGLLHSELGKLRAAGIDVRTDGNRYSMHHKVIIVDTIWTIVGSFNFTANAARSNDENVLIIKNPEIARKFQEEYERIAISAQPAP